MRVIYYLFKWSKGLTNKSLRCTGYPIDKPVSGYKKSIKSYKEEKGIKLIIILI